MADAAGEAADKQLVEMREARSVPAVLKLKLIALRASHPNAIVFVFEGIDDKRVYYHWIRRIAPELRYEPLVCNGKGPLLGFVQALERDRAGLRRGTYFFVDRDYDDLRGLPARDYIYMTDTYSFENSLVAADVVDELLKGDLHCHGEPECRSKVVQLFETQYDAFLQITREVNARLFKARRLNIDLIEPLPNRASALADIQLDSVQPSEHVADALVKLQREPSPEESAELEFQFAALEPRKRFRGKFALLFLYRWVHHLVLDRNSDNSKHFAEVDAEPKAKNSISLDSLAAWASLPTGLLEFVNNVAPPANAA
jgi:hypothetical protein